MKNNQAQTIRLQDYTVPDYFISKVALKIKLGEEITVVQSHLSMMINPASQKKSPALVLQGESLTLISVILNGVRLREDQYSLTDSTLTIPNVPEAFELEIETNIKPQENTALSGLYKSSGNFCTQCEAEGFRRITYFLDRPDVMTCFTTTIIADKSRYPILLSNGNLMAKGDLPEGQHWVQWEDPFKKPSYLFALVAGQLELLEDHFVTQSGRKIALCIYVEKGNQDKCAHAMQAVKKAMRWDEVHYGREYDLDTYMIVAVSDFNMGAMENKGLNIFNTKYILAKPETATDADYVHIESVIAHEYFHNWTGNRITCRDWFQLSLKEGLTVFRDQSFTADMTSKTVARIQDVNMMRIRQFPEDAGPLAHPVQPDAYLEINNFYTATVYNKGAEVIRMMQTILGESLFRQGMDLYFTRHDGFAVTIEDFVKAMEDASKIDLTQFRLWYKQAGTPMITVSDHYDAAKKAYTLTMHQSCPATPGQADKKVMQIPVKIGLLDQSGKEIPIKQSILNLKNQTQSFQFDDVVSKPIPSLLRNFSAPVKIQYDYSDAELQTLFKHDADQFNRWEAGQKYAINLALRLIKTHQQGGTLSMPKEFIATFQHILQSPIEDKSLLAAMLTLPSEIYMSEQMEVIDVDAIHAVSEFMALEIAKQAKPLLLNCYQKNHDKAKPYHFSNEEMGKRDLKNRCLAYLMLLPETDIHEQLGLQQFKDALSNNMTDAIAALACLSNVNYSLRPQVLAEFYKAWQTEALVVDKWFAIQAGSRLPGTLAHVKELLKHPAFDIKNPNKVYALIGVFGQHNLAQFHTIDGSGYQFLSDVIQELDVLNPQVAARMIKPLIDWKRYDVKRQKLMRAPLEIIAKNKKISKDVYELVNKSLN